MTNLKNLDELRADVNATLTKLNAAITDGNFTSVNDCQAELDENIKKYNARATQLEYERLANSTPETIVAEAIKALKYDVIRKKAERTEGILTGYLIEDAAQYIKLLEFDKYLRSHKIPAFADDLWRYKLEKFNYLMAMRCAKSVDDLPKRVRETYLISDMARKIKMGETPTSNRATLKALQGVIDSIIFIDNGKGGNTLKASSHDVAFLDLTMTREGRGDLAVAMSTNDTMARLVMKITHKILLDKAYTLEFKESGAKSSNVNEQADADTTDAAAE